MTKYTVIDNSGALQVHLIRILKKKKGEIGDVIVISIIKALSNRKVKKGEIYKALIVRTKRGIRRKDGTQLQFGDNCVVLLTTDFMPIGTRIFGPIPLEIQKHKKIASLASYFI